MNKDLLWQIRAARPDELWFDRKGALRMGAALIWLAIRGPYVVIRSKRSRSGRHRRPTG